MCTATTTRWRPRARPRAVRRRELFRIAAADLVGGLDVEDVGCGADRRRRGRRSAAAWRLRSAASSPSAARRCRRGCAVIAMGRFGGRELGYGSDADVLFVHDPLPGADEREASDAARGGRRAAPAARPCRPRAAAGHRRRPAARGPPGPAGAHPRRPTPSTTSAGRWSGRPRRCCAPSRSPGTPSSASGSSRWSTRCADPAGGLDEAAVREIRRIKARVEAERLPAGRRPEPAHQARPRRPGRRRVDGPAAPAAPRRHAVPALRTTRTLAALRGGRRAGLLEPRRRRDAARRPGGWRPACATRSCS